MKTNSFRHLLFVMLAAPLVLLSGCSKKDPEPDNGDKELITTAEYVLTPVGGGTTVRATFRDLDGDGGAAPTITPLTLAANTSYTGTLTFLDETKNPAVNISDEVRQEANDHLIGYTTTPAALLTIARTDRDGNNRELGLQTTLRANAAGSGSLRIVLYHQPGTKNATTNLEGSELQVNFPVTVQ
ncbi:hypothetical protein GCM10023185_12020 [Hymenobacter saemangeumensis]|uniref:Type 1 periplasmic binding fold superfamily protein n=1 Tax=Hymenobacter saemangeumensis TaxID=1084522 RepID=A0ABP8I6G4_9BACT